MTFSFETWLMVQVIKEDMERSLKNTNMKPLNHSSYLRLQVLCQCFWDVEEKLCTLKNLSLPDLSAFVPDLLSQVCSSFCLFRLLLSSYSLACLYPRTLVTI